MNILLTSAGRRTYMVDYFREALKGKGKLYASNSVLTRTLMMADGYVISPNIYDDNYIPFLLDFCKKEKIDAVISLFDIDLPVLAKSKSLFKDSGIELLVSDYEVTEICNDKWLTYKYLNEQGLNQTFSTLDIDEVRRKINTNEIQYPLFIKPRWGMGSIGIYKADNDEELGVFYNKLKREIFNTYLKYESSEDIENCIIIQEAIEGDEYGIEILNNLEGQYVTTFAKKKISMRSGETDIAVTVDMSPFENMAKLVSSSLSHIGILDVDCFVKPNGDIVILEMNCRFGGQYPFSHNAGVNVPKQFVKWLEGESTDSTLITPTVGIRSCKEIFPITY